MRTRNISADIPEEDWDRLNEYRQQRGLKWRGVLIEAAEELPEEERRVEA